MVTEGFQPSDPTRFAEAIRRFDEENARDPNTIEVDGQRLPRELVYARWLSEWVVRLCPQAGEALRLAARCQHLRRWEIPRESFPMDRAGYLRWRTTLQRFHAEQSGRILREVGYPEEMVRRVQELNLKKGLPHDPEMQVLEDALCLVFLEHQLEDLAAKTSEEKLLNALARSWKKMSPAGRTAALGLHYSEPLRGLLARAIAMAEGGETGAEEP
ncbi:DUF4202 domain-containing protein [Limisphaera ngatamarikiensis]|uniref:DUF4202 domain-containing protein n=1 Tax=Limisphaera ngatamarikiensis TaxID=1324935 RepID=A0A6M1RI12_9BACT|nr:DUF4202 domain-containing protein [Limisphaera ngatamarikiensis]NGO39296.1 DUF4202 domain-containing protein [Limisphaera ngatamarikiensis]